MRFAKSSLRARLGCFLVFVSETGAIRGPRQSSCEAFKHWNNFRRLLTHRLWLSLIWAFVELFIMPAMRVYVA